MTTETASAGTNDRAGESAGQRTADNPMPIKIAELTASPPHSGVGLACFLRKPSGRLTASHRHAARIASGVRKKLLRITTTITDPTCFPFDARVMGTIGDSFPDCLSSSAIFRGKGAKIFRNFRIWLENVIYGLGGLFPRPDPWFKRRVPREVVPVLRRPAWKNLRELADLPDFSGKALIARRRNTTAGPPAHGISGATLPRPIGIVRHVAWIGAALRAFQPVA